MKEGCHRASCDSFEVEREDCVSEVSRRDCDLGTVTALSGDTACVSQWVSWLKVNSHPFFLPDSFPLLKLADGITEGVLRKAVGQYYFHDGKLKGRYQRGVVVGIGVSHI